MADSTKDKVAGAAKPAACETPAKDRTAEKTGSAPQEGGNAGVQERMDVIASCGKKVGVVDHVEGGAIKLTKKDSADGQHHFIPTGWVARVDEHVHLNKNAVDTTRDWKSDAKACAACGG